MWQDPINSIENQEILRSFRQLFESSYGPRAGTKILASGMGHMVCTSASSRIINNLQFNSPIIQLLLNFVKSQLCSYDDCGLYVGILSSFIIERAWTHGGANVSKSLKFVSDRCLKLLETGGTECSVAGSSGPLLALAESVLEAKPGCGLSRTDRRHLSVQLLKGFLASVGEEAETVGLGRVELVVQSGPGVGYSELLEGLLYRYPEEEEAALRLCDHTGPWTLILYTCMLDGSLPHADKVSVHQSVRHVNPVVSYMSSMAAQLVHEGVRLLACQKVVHPEVQLVLRRAGVLVLPRLGTELARGLERLSGARGLDALSSEWRHCTGSLDAVTPVTKHGKLYLQLGRRGADVTTLLVYSSVPKVTEELEMVMKQVLGSLKQFLLDPKLIPGSGCFESWLAGQLREDVEKCKEQAPKPSEVMLVLGWVEAALLRVPRLLGGGGVGEVQRDSVTRHAWLEEAPVCLCRGVSRQAVRGATWIEIPCQPALSQETPLVWQPKPDNVVDVFRSKACALAKVFEACQLILATGTVIHS